MYILMTTLSWLYIDDTYKPARRSILQHTTSVMTCEGYAEIQAIKSWTGVNGISVSK